MAKSAGIKVVQQKKGYDCGIAALAMLLDKSYGDVSVAVRVLYDKKKVKRGLAIYQLQAVSAELGTELKKVNKAKGYLQGKTGILGVNGGITEPGGHWVILKDGDTVIDPSDSSVYKLYDYLEECKCRTATLLVIDK